MMLDDLFLNEITDINLIHDIRKIKILLNKIIMNNDMIFRNYDFLDIE